MLARPHGVSVFGGDISCNTRIKAYPDGSREILVCDREIFRDSGWEAVRLPKAVPPAKRKPNPSPEGMQRAMRRARAQVRDMALCTPFKFFVTLTLDKSQVDRHDMAAITRKLNVWCDNQVRRRGLAYVLVPERHKDGAVHFHGFFNDALQTVDSGTLTMPSWGKPRKPRNSAQRALWLSQGAQVVYNLPGWSLGFTTAIGLYGEYAQAVSYVCKYIGKGGEKIGGRWYYSGGDLGHPEVSYCDCALRDVEDAPDSYSFTVNAAELAFVLLRVKGGVKDDSFTKIHSTGIAVPVGGLLRPDGQDGLRGMRHLFWPQAPGEKGMI